MKLSSLFKPVMLAGGVSHDSSYIELGDGTLRVKMGPWFDEVIPLDEITAVKSSEWPWYGGLGTKLGPDKGGVGVVGAQDGVVALHFKSPLQVKLWVIVTDIKVDCTDLRTSLEEPEAFIRAIREVCNIPA